MVRHAVLWLMALLLVPIGGGRETHMAETNYYDQTFAAGSSAWNVSPWFYNRPGGSSADPLYPEVYYAEGVYLNGSGRMDSGGPTGYSYAFASFRGGDVSGAAFPGGPFSIPEGFFEVVVTPNAASRTAGSSDGGEIFQFPSNVLVWWNKATQRIWIDAFSFSGGEEFTDSAAWNPANDTTYTVRLEWKVGTGGYMRVLVDGVTMLDSAVTMAGPFSASLNGATEDILHSYSMGGNSIFGAYSRIRFGIVSADTVSVPPLVDNSVPCCHDTSPAGSGAAGDVLGEPNTAPLPEWTPRCASGGTYPAGTPVTHSEDWTA